jgi:hypothetical protein
MNFKLLKFKKIVCVEEIINSVDYTTDFPYRKVNSVVVGLFNQPI